MAEITKLSKIAVLAGGMSSEREVSLRSGKNVLNALLRKGYERAILIDVDSNIAEKLKQEKIEFAYNTLHGRYGEDGCIQGLLEFMGIPYTGSGVKSSAICMDKCVTKEILGSAGLPIIKSICVTNKADLKLARELKFPLMVKPASEGSSIGMNKVETFEELESAFDIAKISDSKILLEEYLQGESATVGVLEGADGEVFATPILGFETKNEWYDFESKYTDGMTKFILPANFSEELTDEIKKLAIEAHKACECSGVSRVDFLVYEDKPYILEINTNPGMTDLSDLPAQADCMGIEYDELVELVLKTASLKMK